MRELDIEMEMIGRYVEIDREREGDRERGIEI